jgi:hypothetical protein
MKTQGFLVEPQPVYLGAGKWHYDPNGDGRGVLFRDQPGELMTARCPHRVLLACRWFE